MEERENTSELLPGALGTPGRLARNTGTLGSSLVYEGVVLVGLPWASNDRVSHSCVWHALRWPLGTVFRGGSRGGHRPLNVFLKTSTDLLLISRER